mgnify:FL=1
MFVKPASSDEIGTKRRFQELDDIPLDTEQVVPNADGAYV